MKKTIVVKQIKNKEQVKIDSESDDDKYFRESFQ